MTAATRNKQTFNEALGKAALHPMQTSAEFVAGFVPPDSLIDGLLQKRYVYSLTAPTGNGKTSVLLCILANVARGLTIGYREVVKCKCLFLAGENPDDIRTRWIKLCEDMGVEPADMDVIFLPGTMDLSAPVVRTHIEAQAAIHGEFGLIAVDTSAAYFYGDDENSNAQSGPHARMFRSLTSLPGGPTVIVTCHPTKTPNMDSLQPRGGGAFIAEMDGNLVCLRNGPIVELHWQVKFRGPDFEPIPFKLVEGFSEKLRDSKDRLIKTVTAQLISPTEAAETKENSDQKETLLLSLMAARPRLSVRDMAAELRWFLKTSDPKGAPHPNVGQVQRTMQVLRDKKLIEKSGGQWVVTKKGQKAASTWRQGDLDLASEVL